MRRYIDSASSAISAVMGCPHDGEAAQPSAFVFVAGGGLDWLNNWTLTWLFIGGHNCQ